MKTLIFEKESFIIRGGAFAIYKEFRNRHKENVYQKALHHYLVKQGLRVDREKQLPIYFDGEKVGTYTPNFVINEDIIVELKCKPRITKDDLGQFWHYMTSSRKPLGFLINFGAKDGVQIIRRIYKGGLHS
jgi:GxxExxY protein